MSESRGLNDSDNPARPGPPNGDVEHQTDSGASPSSSDGEKPAPTAQPDQKKDDQPSKLKAAWAKLGLDWMTLKMMTKGAVPPTVAIAMYQNDAVSETYGNLGYLVAISSILGFCIMPRGKFLNHILLSVVSVCFAAALNLLALYCVVKARLHTTPAGQPPVGYNASASAVCAAWLCAQIFLISVVRVARPQFMFPAILASIFAIVSLSNGVLFPSQDYVNSFMQQLLSAFLTGFALAAATHFLIWPTSSRLVVFKELTGYLQLMNGVLQTQTAYMASLETYDPRERKQQADADKKTTKTHKEKKAPAEGVWTTPASAKVKELMGKLIELHTKLQGDITPAKREVAIGKLESHDLTELWKLSRSIFLPVLGLSSMINILERSAELMGWDRDHEPTEHEDSLRQQQVESVHSAMKFLHKPFAEMTGVLGSAFQHILITLELVKPPKEKKPDEESRGNGPPTPGTPGFAETLKMKVDEFYESKKRSLQDWASENGINLPPNFFDSSFTPDTPSLEQAHNRDLRQRQLFFVLYLEYLLWRVAKAVLDLVLFVDKRKQDDAFKRSKVIFPGSKTIYSFIKAAWAKEDTSQDDSFTQDMASGGADLYLGQDFNKKDPEHEPPRNAWERFGEKVRYIPKFFRSDASAFGLRVVAATMSLGIVCYLRDTQEFFLENRLLWALIMVAISMSRTSGASSFQYVLRVFGTAVAMVASYIIWYICDGKTAGVIVFLYVWMAIGFFILLKAPKLIIVAILSIVTSVLIVGYELQVREIGVKAATSSGQPAYPLYILAPYRLATVAAGILVSFIFTIFPYPVSESTELRKDLAASLNLMSAYYENVHETVQARAQGRTGNKQTKGSHGYNLEKGRMAIFAKLIFVLESLKTNSAFSKFQLRVGGRFPHEEYDELIQCMNRLLLWTSLLAYASSDFDHHPDPTTDASRTLWAADLRKVIAGGASTGHRITSLMSLLASSLTNGQPLPPYLEMPPKFHLARQLSHKDRDLVSARHIAEPEYTAFAVLQVASQCINTDIAKLVGHVKNLVGELDFSFHAISSSHLADDSDDDEKLSD